MALDNLNLIFNSGVVEGILGPNGSGKTTALRIMAGIVKMDSGSIMIDGKEVEDYKKFSSTGISYVPEAPVLYETLTGDEYCDIYAEVRKDSDTDYYKRKERIADALSISGVMGKPIGTLSFGTKQKISILSALASDPQILILDESLNGLDPASIIVVKEVIKEMTSTGHFVIFSTHLLDIAEIVCQRVQILNKGKRVLEGNMDDLQGDGESGFLEKLFLNITGNGDLIDRAKRVGDYLYRSEDS